MMQQTKQYGLTILCFFCLNGLGAQTLNDKLEKIANRLSEKVRAKRGNVHLAVYPFTSLKKNEDLLSMHTFGEFHTALEAVNGGHNIMDRETLSSYLAEHQLNQEDLIDKSTAKEFGKLIAVDGYVTGKIYKFGSVLNFQLKVTDTQTGQILSSVSEKLPIDYDMAEFLGLENWQKKREEAEENKSQHDDCEELSVGDYCFANLSTIESKVRITAVNGNFNRQQEVLLPPKMKTCFKNLPVGSYSFTVIRADRANIVGQSNVLEKGYFTVKKCESRLHKIGQEDNGFANSEAPLVLVVVSNPNYYARQLVFKDKNGKMSTYTVGSRSTAEIEVPEGVYEIISKTVFSKTVVQRVRRTIRNNMKISLTKDDFN